MKRISNTVFSAFVLLLCSTVISGCAGKNPKGTALPSFLKAETVAAIAAADSVLVSVIGTTPADGSIPAPETMSISGTSKPLEGDRLAALVRIILSPDSYRTDIVRKVPFLATWKLTFSGDKGTAVLFIGKECLQVKEAGAASPAEEFDPVAGELIPFLEFALKD